MQVTHMTYTRVAHDVTPGAMTERPHDAGVDTFLIDHVRALLDLANTGDAPTAVFVDQQARGLFDQLRSGTSQQFLDAARALSTRLVGYMDRRSAAGLLVCLRLQDGQSVSAAALKLEVVTEHAAVLEALDTGEEVLSAVTNVLDAPGDLQKGALVDDPRPDSAVVIGDRLARDALYFPTALGIRTEQSAADAAVDLLKAVGDQLPDSARQIAGRLHQIEPGTTEEVLTSLGTLMPAVTADMAAQISNVLAERQRPVRLIDTRASVKEVIQADGITITVPTPSIGAVTIEPDVEGGWRIVIRVLEQPHTVYRR